MEKENLLLKARQIARNIKEELVGMWREGKYATPGGAILREIEKIEKEKREKEEGGGKEVKK